MASGFGICGSGIGAFSLPPLVQYLFSNLNYFNALLLIGAIQLNLCVCATFYRPIEDNYRPQKGKQATGLLLLLCCLLIV